MLSTSLLLRPPTPLKRPTGRPTTHRPTDRPTDRPTPWRVSIRAALLRRPRQPVAGCARVEEPSEGLVAQRGAPDVKHGNAADRTICTAQHGELAPRRAQRDRPGVDKSAVDKSGGA